MTDLICDCQSWEYYIKNYNDTFYWNNDTNSWYIRWVHLSERDGYTQVSRYAIPITHCPLCGGELKKSKGH